MTRCTTCQKQVIEDSETHRKFDQYPDMPHRCQLSPRPIPRFELFEGMTVYRNPAIIAAAITNECIRCYMDPYKVRLEVKENVIILH